MTEEIMIDVTKCDFNTFDGGGSQRTICTLDNCYCDGIRAKDCYFKQLIRLKQENKELKNKNICRETCEYFKRICNENTLLIKYRSALEEIRDYLYTLTTVDSDFPNTETYLRINDKIEEVLE